MSGGDNRTGTEDSDTFRHKFRWAVGVVGRGKWIVFGCMLLVIAPVVVYLYKAERLYTARVEILIEAPSEAGDSLLERSYGKGRLTESFIQTEADILASASLAGRVVDKLRLNQDPEFNTSLRPPSPWLQAISAINPLPLLTGQKASEQELSPAGREQVEQIRVQGVFMSRLNVKSRRRSFVITTEFTANNGEKAAQIANTLADMYIMERLEGSLQEVKRTNDWLAKRLEELRRDVAIAEKAAEQYRGTHNLGQRRKGERQLTVNDQQLVELNSRLAIARSDLAPKQARHDQIRRLQNNQRSLETAYDVLQSTLIQRLREQEALKERELSEATKTYGDRHPRIIGLRADLDELRGKIVLEIDKIAVSLSTEAEAARIGVVSLERQIAQLQQGSNESGGQEVELRELERQAETSRTLYEAFLSRYKRDAEQERIQRANARVLSQALIPLQPSSPRRIRVFLASIAISLLGGVGLVFLLDRLNGRIRVPEEMEELTGIPPLASIPRLPGRKNDRVSHAYVIVDSQRSQLANVFRSLKSVLAARANGNGSKVILVTSSLPAEGKSFVVRNLAITLAAGGSKVLVVDGDLLRPSQHESFFGEKPLGQGITQWLSDPTVEPMSLVVRDDRGRFDLLPAGRVDERSSHALSEERFVQLIAMLSPYYDRIIIDAPPIIATTDVLVLSKAADQLIFVVKWNDTSREAIRMAISHLANVGAPISGFVLSQVNPKSGWSGGYGAYGAYGYYARYDS